MNNSEKLSLIKLLLEYVVEKNRQEEEFMKWLKLKGKQKKFIIFWIGETWVARNWWRSFVGSIKFKIFIKKYWKFFVWNI